MTKHSGTQIMTEQDMNWYQFEAIQIEVDLLWRYRCIDKSVMALVASISREVMISGRFSGELRKRAVEVQELLATEEVSERYKRCVAIEESQRI